jgi:SAM-dependent methyltransferase
VLTGLQYWILNTAFRTGGSRGNACAGKSKLENQLGKEFLDEIAGKTVIDFGCGEGLEAMELARRQAGAVIGLDIREEVLNRARQNAIAAGVAERCHFAQSTSRLADFIVSIDAFEHFADPAGILRVMETLLKPEGELIVSFGPTWYHPLGGHLFSVFPWAHLLFSEKALLRWRSTFKSDGATRFGEVEGGLNQMTIRRFERIVERSPFRFASFEPVPIGKLRRLHNRWTREFTTATVRCRLVKRAAAPLAKEARP